MAAFQKLPDVFKPYVDQAVWVVWKQIQRSDGSYTKPPYRADRPSEYAEPNNPATWARFEVALAAYRRGEADGIGIVLRDTNLIGLDLDKCIHAGGEVEPAARWVIESAGSYVERSPSETGFHIFGVGSGPRINRKQMVPDANGMSIEIARKAEKFFTITGDIADGSTGKFADIDAFADKVEKRLDAQKEKKEKKPRGGKRKLDLDDIIKNGEGGHFGGDRSKAVWWVVNELIRRGKTDDEIVAVLLDRGNRVSDHVYDQKQGTEKYARRQVAQARSAAPRADGGLEDRIALQFSAQYADSLRFVAAWKRWYQWDGWRWLHEETLHAFHLARVLCRAANDAKNKTVVAVVALARTDRRQAATTAQWDKNQWLLGTPKGTVDLRTGKLQEPKPTDYITKITRVVPSDKPPRDSCPMFLTFLNRVTNGNEELQDYLQRVFGYCLTGVTIEDALFFFYGKGANGKSVLMRTVASIVNEYHEAASMDMFVVSRNERHPTDLAQLRGARLVTAVETEEGKRWDESKLKHLTGGDPVDARFMRQDFFKYIPQFKLLFAGNHKPAIRNVDVAISRRFHLIPFLVVIPPEKRDLRLFDKMRDEWAEWPGILRWMIDGCLEWQRIGLKPPKIVTDATKDYLESQDTTQNFFDDCCVIAKDEYDTFEHLRNGFVDWADHCREFVGTKKAFGQKLKDRDFQMIRYGADRAPTYLGIRCIRENAKVLKEEATRKTAEARRSAPPDEEPE